MDPLLEQTDHSSAHRRAVARRRRDREIRRRRQQSRFEQWAWTEIPAYRLGLLLSYASAIYFGVSALIAGVPAFNIAAPEGWTPIWSALLILSGPIGLVGIARDTPKFRITELVASALQSLTLLTYAGTILFLAYLAGDTGRAAVGAGFAWLCVGPLIRTFWLIPKVLSDHKSIRAKD